MKKYLLMLFFPLSLCAFSPEPISPYPVVGYQTITFQDDIFNIPRDIMVWYPVDPTITGAPSDNKWDVFNVADKAPVKINNQKLPVVVISHGYNGNPHQLSWLILQLVRRNIIVLGIQHLDKINGEVHVNHWMRARDVSLLLTKFATSQLARYAALDEVGIAGFSLGGTTAVWLEGGRATKLDNIVPGPEYSSSGDFAQVKEALPTLKKEMMSRDWSDPRIKAAFIMAPSWAWLFDEEHLKTIAVPTFLIAAEADEVVVTKNNAGYFAKNIPNAIFQQIPGKASHYVFISELNDKQKGEVDPNHELPAELFVNDVSVDRKWIQLQVGEEAAGFFLATFKTH